MKIINDTQLDFDDVLIRPVNSELNKRSDVNILYNYHINNCFMQMCPIMSANMTQTGTFNVAESMIKNDCFATLHKFYKAEDIIKFMQDKKITTSALFVTVGIRNSEDEIKKLQEIDKSGNSFSILVDVPNAYIPEVKKFIKKLRNIFPDKIIAAGNVCTHEGTQSLINCGADIVKVGVGPSGVCDTRIKTGVGRSQLSAILECSHIAHIMGKYIIADGGFKNAGDICKAIVAGADICMSGSLFAGTDESNGDIITKYYRTDEYDMVNEKPIFTSKKYKEYYGMSSFRAQRENYNKTTESGTSEGVECKLVPYTGPIINTIKDIKGGLRSCGTYINAKNINDFNQALFFRVNRVK